MMLPELKWHKIQDSIYISFKHKCIWNWNYLQQYLQNEDIIINFIKELHK